MNAERARTIKAKRLVVPENRPVRCATRRDRMSEISPRTTVLTRGRDTDIAEAGKRENEREGRKELMS